MIDRIKTCYDSHDSAEYASDMFVSAVAWNLLCCKNVKVQQNTTLSALASMMAHFSNQLLAFKCCWSWCFIGISGTFCNWNSEPPVTLGRMLCEKWKGRWQRQIGTLTYSNPGGILLLAPTVYCRYTCIEGRIYYSLTVMFNVHSLKKM